MFNVYIYDEHVETAENLDIIMPMYNLLEYSDNYADSSGSLWQFKRDEQNMTDARNLDNVTKDSSFCKYKSNLLKGLDSRDVANVCLVECSCFLDYFWDNLEVAK